MPTEFGKAFAELKETIVEDLKKQYKHNINEMKIILINELEKWHFNENKLIANIEMKEKNVQHLVKQVIEQKTNTLSIDTALANEAYERSFGVFAPSATGSEDAISIENEKLSLSISPKGGRMATYEILTAQLDKYDELENDIYVLYT